MTAQWFTAFVILAEASAHHTAPTRWFTNTGNSSYRGYKDRHAGKAFITNKINKPFKKVISENLYLPSPIRKTNDSEHRKFLTQTKLS